MAADTVGGIGSGHQVQERLALGSDARRAMTDTVDMANAVTRFMKVWRSAVTPEVEASTPSARSTLCILASRLAAAFADFSSADSPCECCTACLDVLIPDQLPAVLFPKIMLLLPLLPGRESRPITVLHLSKQYRSPACSVLNGSSLLRTFKHGASPAGSP